jgi:hydrogenase maturation factor
MPGEAIIGITFGVGVMEQDELIAKINRLYECRQKLLATGNIAPEGAWIHTYSIDRKFKNGFFREYTYAKWQAHEAIFRRSQ